MSDERPDDEPAAVAHGPLPFPEGLVDVLTMLDDVVSRAAARAPSEGAVAPETPGAGPGGLAGTAGEAAENRSIRRARALGARNDSAEMLAKMAEARRGIQEALDVARRSTAASRSRREASSEARTAARWDATPTEPTPDRLMCGGLGDPDRLAMLAELGPWRRTPRLRWTRSAREDDARARSSPA